MNDDDEALLTEIQRYYVCFFDYTKAVEMENMVRVLTDLGLE